MATDAKNIKITPANWRVSREHRIQALTQRVEEHSELLPPNIANLLRGSEKAANELRNDLQESGFSLNAAVAAVLSCIRSDVEEIQRLISEDMLAIERGELTGDPLKMPIPIAAYSGQSKKLDEFIRPLAGRASQLMRKAMIEGLEAANTESEELFAEHFEAAKHVVKDDWFQPDEWAENRQAWPETLRVLAKHTNHPYFDDLFRARLAENEACFTAGLYLASIATCRMVYEDLLKLGVSYLFGKGATKRFDRRKNKSVDKAPSDLANLLQNKTDFNWFDEGRALYSKGCAMLHSREVTSELNVEFIADRSSSPNESTRQRRGFRLEAERCNQDLERLVQRMESDLKRLPRWVNQTSE